MAPSREKFRRFFTAYIPISKCHELRTMQTNHRLKTFLHPMFILAVVWLATIGCAVLAPSPTPDTGDIIIATAVQATLESVSAAPTLTMAPSLEIFEQVTVTPAAGQTETKEANPEVEVENESGWTTEAPFTIVYVGSDRNLWVWQETGATRQLTQSGDVDDSAVSDDAAWIAFTRTADYVRYGLWLIRNDGSEQKVIMDAADFDALPRAADAVTVMPASFDWVPGSHILAFNTRPAFEGPGLALNDDLWLVNADDGSKHQLFEPGSGGQFFFSPDGEQVALVQPESISLANVDGSDRREGVLEYSSVITYSEYEYYAEPLWAADSSHLLVVVPQSDAIGHPDEPSTIWDIPVDGSPASQVGSFRTAPFTEPVLAPDLNHLVYQTQEGDEADDRRTLHLASLDGSEDRVLVEEIYLQFRAWSPDSNHLLYSYGENSKLMVGRAETGFEAAGDWRNVYQVRWVDANRFLFVEQSGGNIRLWLQSITGEHTQVASFSEGDMPIMAYDFTPLK